MTQGFQQQGPLWDVNIRKSVPTPQHGRKADETLPRPDPVEAVLRTAPRPLTHPLAIRSRIDP